MFVPLLVYIVQTVIASVSAITCSPLNLSVFVYDCSDLLNIDSVMQW